MKNLMFAILFVLISGLIVPGAVRAQDVAGKSARLDIKESNVATASALERGIQRRTIKNVLTRNGSPMAVSVDSFMQACIEYSLDCYLLPSIAGLESTFGKFVWPNSHNAYGWARGYMMFNSWDEGTLTVAKGLRENYLNKGALGVYEIGPIYSESPTWAVRVDFFMKQFKAEEAKTRLLLKQNGVEL